MDIAQITGLVADNWGTITTVGLAVGGSYAVKVQLAIKSVKKALAEGEDVIVANQKALADGTITSEENKVIAKETQEFIISLHEALKNVTAIIPKKFQSKIPIKFGS